MKGGWEWDRDLDAHDRFERRRDGWYFNGHRGSRERHRGYRKYNGFWFPPEAFAGAIIGGIIGGVITSQTPRHKNSYGAVRITREHLVWCEDRYRSYRARTTRANPTTGLASSASRRICGKSNLIVAKGRFFGAAF